jgi:hypothetical protein
MNPNKVRGAKSFANLQKGGTPVKKGTKLKDKEVVRITKKMLADPVYRRTLMARLRTGKIQPGVEVMLWYYGWGKPAETIETKQVIPVRLVHEYAIPSKSDDE